MPINGNRNHFLLFFQWTEIYDIFILFRLFFYDFLCFSCLGCALGCCCFLKAHNFTQSSHIVYKVKACNLDMHFTFFKGKLGFMLKHYLWRFVWISCFKADINNKASASNHISYFPVEIKLVRYWFDDKEIKWK